MHIQIIAETPYGTFIGSHWLIGKEDGSYWLFTVWRIFPCCSDIMKAPRAALCILKCIVRCLIYVMKSNREIKNKTGSLSTV